MGDEASGLKVLTVVTHIGATPFAVIHRKLAASPPGQGWESFVVNGARVFSPGNLQQTAAPHAHLAKGETGLRLRVSTPLRLCVENVAVQTLRGKG